MTNTAHNYNISIKTFKIKTNVHEVTKKKHKKLNIAQKIENNHSMIPTLKPHSPDRVSRLMCESSSSWNRMATTSVTRNKQRQDPSDLREGTLSVHV